MLDWAPILLSLQLAAITTIILVIIGVPFAYLLSISKSRFKFLIEALVGLPLVLPPTVLGFYLLMAFSPNAGLGKWLSEVLGLELIFSFEGLVIGSVIYSLPFMVQPIQAGFEHLPKSYREAALLMGKSNYEILCYVYIPNIRQAFLSGVVLTFAHTIGEFGVVLMLGGKIAGETKVASIAIYDEVESLNYAVAHSYSILLLILCFIILAITYSYKRNADI